MSASHVFSSLLTYIFLDIAGKKDAFLLPVPAFNVINGGSHAGNKLAMQEFMVCGFALSTS